MLQINPLNRVPSAASRLLRVALPLVCLFAFFWRLGAAPLFDLDEALYVVGARQMLLTGDRVTPRLNSRPLYSPAALTVPFYEKPILVYWFSAASQRVFGMNRLAARLPAAFAALITTGMIAFFGSRRYGERAGLLAGIVYATAPLTLLDARQMTTDGLLVLWLTAGLLCAAPNRDAPQNSHTGIYTRRLEFVQTLFFWIFCALAVLTKGAIGALLPALILGLYAATETFSNRAGSAEASNEKLRVAAVFAAFFSALWRAFRRLRPLPGLALFLLICAPWHLLAARSGERDAQGRTFFQEYGMRQHVNRFRGGKNGDKVHASPPITYFAFFAVGFFPWAFFVPAAFRQNRDQKPREAETSRYPVPEPPLSEAGEEAERRLRRFLLAWFGTVFVFFSISAAKLPTYIAPLYPPASLLVGRWLDSVLQGQNREQARRGALGAALGSGLLFAAGLIAPRFLPPNLSVPVAAIHLAQTITAILFFGSLLALACFAWKRDEAAPFGLIALTLMLLAVVGVGVTAGYDFAAREGFGPYQRLAEQANVYAAQNIPIVYYDIVPRAPSMLYRANYAPREFSRAPLLPSLRMFLKSGDSAIVILSQKTLQTKLQPEIAAAPDFTWQILARDGTIDGGWVLLEIRRKSQAAVYFPAKFAVCLDRRDGQGYTESVGYGGP